MSNKRLQRIIVTLGIAAAAVTGGLSLEDWIREFGGKGQYYKDLKSLCSVQESSCAVIKWLHPRLKIETECYAYVSEKDTEARHVCRDGVYYAPGVGGIDSLGNPAICPVSVPRKEKIPYPCTAATHQWGEKYLSLRRADDKSGALELLQAMALETLSKELGE